MHLPNQPNCPLPQCQDNVVTKGDLKSFSFDQLVKFNLQKCSSDSDCELVPTAQLAVWEGIAETRRSTCRGPEASFLLASSLPAWFARCANR